MGQGIGQNASCGSWHGRAAEEMGGGPYVQENVSVACHNEQYLVKPPAADGSQLSYSQSNSACSAASGDAYLGAVFAVHASAQYLPHGSADGLMN